MTSASVPALASEVAPARPSASDALKQIALEEFAAVGYLGTSLQHIADKAGVSKSSVLYHFESKEALLEAVLTPAIDAMEALLTSTVASLRAPGGPDRYVVEFVDLLLDNRLAVHIFINQGQSIIDLPVIHRANRIVRSLAASMTSEFSSPRQQIRFGIALGGAAYILVAAANWGAASTLPPDETRAALISVVRELLIPMSGTSTI